MMNHHRIQSRRFAYLGFLVAATLLFVGIGCQETKRPVNLVGPQLGEYFYGKKCAPCHGIDGRGHTKLGVKLKVRNHTDPVWQASITDEDMKQMIMDGKGKMPAFGKKFDPEELQSLVQFIRSVRE